MIVYPNTLEENELLKQWLMQRVNDFRSGKETMCVAVMRGGEIAAVVGWSNYRGRDIEVCFASDNPRWAHPSVIRELLLYPFGQLGCDRVTAMVYKSNRKSRRLVEGLGFKMEGKHRHAGLNKESILSYGMTKDDFIEKWKNVRKQTPTSTATAA